MSMPLKVAHAARLLKGTLHRGYTTARDPAGGEIGLQLAINQGLMEGNPLENIHLMAQPDENFSMIMKGGDFVRRHI